MEQYCATGCVWTYNSKSKYPHMREYNAEGGAPTYGGYSKHIVVDQNFVLTVPANLDMASSAPLLCAGVTVWSPMVKFGVHPRHHIAVLGLGGLGHMAAKFGVAFGCHVTVISRGLSKKESCFNELHIHDFIDSTNDDEMKAHAGNFDFIIDTICAPHNINEYVKLLKVEGTFCVVGAIPGETSISTGALLYGRKVLTASLIGGIRETQEMLDFCGRHNITCLSEVIKADYINEAYDRVCKSDVKYRFVIDTSSI